MRRVENMKNKKILAILFLVITLSTLVVPMFSLNILAYNESEQQAYDDGYQAGVDDTLSQFAIPEGTYLFNDVITVMPSAGAELEMAVSFLSYNDRVNYQNIKVVVSNVNNDVWHRRVQVYYKEFSTKNYVIAYDSEQFYSLEEGLIGSTGGWYPDKQMIIITSIYVDPVTTFLNGNGQFISGYIDLGDIYQQSYSQGYSAGYNTGYEEGFSQDILGNTLSAPFRSLNSVVLWVSPSGFTITLFGVFGAVVSLLIFIAFLKMFAGG